MTKKRCWILDAGWQRTRGLIRHPVSSIQYRVIVKHPDKRASIFGRALGTILVFWLVATNLALADAEQDWRKIVELDAMPKVEIKTAEQAQELALQRLDLQEKAIRAFLAGHPADAHAFEGWMRLSHLLAIRSDLQSKPEAYAEALRILDDLESRGATPRGKLPDVAFARITLLMHHTPKPDPAARESLMAYVRKFQTDYPADHRTGDLLAEMATLYDLQPQKKRELLNEALPYAGDDELKQRIHDDLKRLDMLGKPLALKFNSVQGEAVDVAAYRGKVVLVYFFAGWSIPSQQGLVELKRIAEVFPKNKFQVIGISLDQSRPALLGALGRLGVDWPVAFDGKGWESPLARSLGINILPTAWVLDRGGNLRTLNALDNTEAVIRFLVEEK